MKELNLITERDIVINTDLDGILCGIILQNYFSCKIIGFCDSKENIWLKGPACVKSLSDLNCQPLTFVDIFITKEDVVSIDQHIVAIDKQHCEEIYSNENKINPNLNRMRTAQCMRSSCHKDEDFSYFCKYPFGTVHYLIALAEKGGIQMDINNNDLNGLFSDLSLFDLILRADDAAFSTSGKYRDNCLSWWGWLENIGLDITKNISSHCTQLQHSKARYVKDKLRNIFQHDLGCKTADGGFSNMLPTNGERLNSQMLSYLNIIAEQINMEPIAMKLEDSFSLYRGKWLVEYWNNESIKNILSNPSLFSYAFINCKQISYTLD